MNMKKTRKELTDLLHEYEQLDDSEVMKKGKLKHKIFDEFGTNKKCFRCGSQLLVSDLPDYTYLCFECDENMYEFEVKND